jgi:hypothetical protein
MSPIICMEQAVIVKVQRMYCPNGRGDPSGLEWDRGGKNVRAIVERRA